MERNARQALAVEAWNKSGARGTIIWPPGSGKTRIGELGVNKMLSRYPDYTSIMVAPIAKVVGQWNEKKIPNLNAMTVQSLVKRGEQLECDLLIVDEVHRMAADTFSKVFTLVKFKYILCLTGSINRLDGKQALIYRYAPVCDELTQEDAERFGYIAKVAVYNVPVIIPTEDMFELEKLDSTVSKGMKMFGNDYSHITNIIKNEMVMLGNRLVPYVEALSVRMQINSNTLRGVAYNTSNSIRKRKTLLKTHPSKIALAAQIAKHGSELGYKTLIFTGDIGVCESIHSLIPDISGYYHSKATRKVKVDDGKSITLSEYWLREFVEGRISVLISPKSLNTGVDLPFVDLGITVNRDSGTIDDIQTKGRYSRLDLEKNDPMLINLAIANTQDEVWLNKSQDHGKDVRWLNSVDDAFRKITLNARTNRL